jgi:hypothetical protein
VTPRTLTVLAPICQGEEEALRAILRPIGDDIRGQHLGDASGTPRIEFLRSCRIHFARFAVLPDPDRGSNRARLLYSANYDGDLDGHLAELAAITSDMAAIWGRCEGYPGPGDFARFIRARTVEPAACYIAFRDQSVDDVRQGVAFRLQAHALVDEASAGQGRAISAPKWSPAFGRSFREALARVMRALPVVVDLFRAIGRFGVVNIVGSAQQVTASLNRYPLFRVVNRLTGNRMRPMQSAYSSVALDNCARALLTPGDEALSGLEQPPPAFREDVVTQNQLTLVTVLQPGHARRVGAVMAAIDSYAKRLAPSGSLIGISTIHFVKWLIIDNDRRLLMISDYDGSWESYIDEFAEMILSGLDAIWGTAYGYPPDGARDLPAFKRFLRSHQVPSEVFFSAYPDQTVLNIVNDRALARAGAGAPPDPLRGLLRPL